MYQIPLNMPSLAPLPSPIVFHLLKQQRKLLSKTVRTISQDEIDHAVWSLLETKVHEKRPVVYTLMDFILQAEKPSSETYLSTTWLRQMLAAHTPGGKTIPLQTFSLWRERKLLRYRERGHPDADSAAALLLARMVDERIRNWLPTTIEENEPNWWCWQQDAPENPPVPCPVPLPDHLPSSTLLWTPWAGAAWDEHWLKIGKDLGAIRWASAVSKNKRTRWTISQRDLQRWDPEISALTINFPECAEDISHTLAHLALFRLARTRLSLHTRT